MKAPRCNNVTWHFEECGVNELVMHHLLSSSSALFSWLHALSTVDPMQWTVVSSACGMSGNHVLLTFVYYINTIGLYC